MVGRRKHRSKSLSGNHQRCWLWGRHLVLETLAAGVWPVQELWLADDLPEETRQHAASLLADVSLCQTASRARLSQLCAREDHQGFLARMDRFPLRSGELILPTLPPDPLLAVLDAIQDPHNFGAILRSAEIFGMHAVCVGPEDQAEVSSHVARASAGAVNRVTIVETALPPFLKELAGRKVQVLGLSEKANRPLSRVDLRRATALVVGNEGRGLHPEVFAACTDLVRIPQYGTLNSLNAAAAAAIAFYEARRQRDAAASRTDS